MPENKNRFSLFLNKLHFKGFKSIEDLTVKLNPGLNIIIGKNGAGKSNFFEFLDSAITSFYNRSGLVFKSATLNLNDKIGNSFDFDINKIAKQAFHEEESLIPEDQYSQRLTVNNSLIFDSEDDITNTPSIQLNGKQLTIGRYLHTFFSKTNYDIFTSLYVRFNLPDKLAGISTATSLQIPIYNSFWEFNIQSTFLSSVFYRSQFLFVEIRKSLIDYSKENDNIDREATFQILEPQWFLKNLTFPENTINNLIQFSPIKGLRFNKNIAVYNDEKTILVENLKLEFLINEHWLPWSQLSDGTKRLFFIITEITEKDSGLILIEEPELGIHPHQFDLLMQFIKEQSSHKQIILSTHSPKALDHLGQNELDQILIAVYDREKGTQLNHLTPEQIQKAITYMNEVGYLSDYWLLSDLEE
ncbi:hypothetical protein TH53_03240 [Pedobacter lusitanus]|uniref:ATPase AAA-type core domain-containing protein n=1 Tax=Pedobacter lusitanus TaxID=1503925 RepID=A0A0D0F9T4_9SPHI|nr:ATP-binding protein [Pedobacter lusitanus]KIO78533.1 hypothetical protein TH53_03240 [Pedobacter lusitanus]